ncbi:hypothetical protein GPECTOR_463g374 [Gonium pectorale]|uniref:SOUL heme-binding protein n=1 Tax=Gonium pectorale TaxID=33097 RepID=A0A150FV45_GONPE|nr:hypothetical protein GPECTOR_463g374 [Gonium pectorale]|eukprot:KXZ41448.1 hypothetical protein GPECTOR_463g374 [Gonium pectorale]
MNPRCTAGAAVIACAFFVLEVLVLYEEVVDFRDPITRYSSLSGYLFNIAFLRRAFDPAFTLHDMRLTGPTDVTTRWTMSMRFTPAGALPTRKYWNPTITFTGTSTYVFNPASGKVYRHIDTWDSIRNQEFFSLEGFADFFSQLLSFYSTPGLETPQYTILRRAKDYEVRRYDPYVVAETAMEAAGALNREVLKSGQVSVSPAGPGNRAFNSLAKYIFGDNAARARMAMTTPVFSDTTGTMRFVIGPSALKAMPSLPAPNSDAVSLGRLEGGVFAARVFSGVAREADSAAQAEALKASLVRDGLKTSSPVWTLARYNDPSTPGPFRRNEVLLPLEDFDLWH